MAVGRCSVPLFCPDIISSEAAPRDALVLGFLGEGKDEQFFGDVPSFPCPRQSTYWTG